MSIDKFKFLILNVLIYFTPTCFCFSQDATPKGVYSRPFNIGMGFGIDYGGIGLRLTAIPEDHLALFFAFGYNLNGMGVNSGASYRFSPENKTIWYFTMMYGYNTVFRFEDAPHYNETYYGISTGFGAEIHSKKYNANFWNLELLIPLRTREYYDDLLKYKNNMQLKSEPLPFAISIGYHFGLG